MNQRQKIRQEYFEAKGLGVPSIDQVERYNKVCELLMHHEHPNFETALMLFDAVEDKKDPDWLFLMGWIYDQHPNNPFSDEEKAFKFYSKSSELGNSFSSYKIADNYFNAGKKDKAIFWLQKSFWQRPDVETALKIFDLHREKLGIEAVEIPALSKEVKEIIVEAAKIDTDNARSGSLKYMAAGLLVQGLDVPRDVTVALKYYEDVIKQSSSISFFPLRAAVIRHALGLGVDQDLDKAKNLYYSNPKMRCNCIGYYEPLEELLDKAGEDEFKESINYFRSLYESGNGYEILLKDIESGNLSSSRSNFLVANAIKVLARTESWAKKKEWLDGFYHIRLLHNGFDPKKVMADTWRLGPFYNPVAKNGLPVLGLIQDEHFGTPGFFDGASIEPGITAFAGLTANDRGELTLHFTESTVSPAFLLPEDVDTALALAFGKDHFQWPSIDMPMHHSNDGEMEEAQSKGVDPDWLIETPIGPTLYITDFLGGRLSWAIDRFEIADTELGDKARSLVSYLKNIKAPEPNGNVGQQINVNPKNVERYLETVNEGAEKIWNLSVGKIEMKITSGYSMKGNGSEKKKWHYKDNLKYRHGQICAALTDNFDTVAQIIPAYERLKQFIGMVYALNDLKEAGFKPNSELQRHILQKQAEFEKRVEGKALEYARSLPLTEKLEIGC